MTTHENLGRMSMHVEDYAEPPKRRALWPFAAPVAALAALAVLAWGMV